MRQMRQLPHQNNMIRYNSVEIEAGFASIRERSLNIGEGWERAEGKLGGTWKK